VTEPALSDDQVFHIYDLLPDDLNLRPNPEEGRTHFTGRNYDWWRDILGHPKAHPGCCKACGCATSCLLGVFHEGAITAAIQELGRIGVIRGLPYMDCGRVDAEERHSDHAWIEPEMGPCLCDGYEPGGES
jgi:hypothetical protein